MVLSFIVFPGVLQARPVTFIGSVEWNGFLIVGLFNICDVIGRTVGGIPKVMISAESTFWLHLFAFSRISIVILAILIEVGLLTNAPHT